jgi:D-Tyr-tRNA(Tyr) deacylase
MPQHCNGTGSESSGTSYTAILICSLVLLFSCNSDAMRLVVQRVKSASVTVDGSIVSSIDRGAMALVGLHEHDTTEDLEYCCRRLLGCKLWENEAGALWRQGAKQLGLEILCVSQFTVSVHFVDRRFTGSALKQTLWIGPEPRLVNSRHA